MCIFITGVVRSRGDKERDKIAVGTVKTQQCSSYWDARNTLSKSQKREDGEEAEEEEENKGTVQ